jgi:flagellar biosynthetic protein FliR
LNLPLDPRFVILFFLMFMRLGTMVMLMPGVGERMMPARFRLIIAFGITLVLMPVHQKAYAVDATNALAIVGAGAIEFVIGLIFGLSARIAMSSLVVAGSVIAQAMGIGFAMQVDPTQGQQSAVIGNFLTLLGVAVVMTSGLDHMVIISLSRSFDLLKPGEYPVTGDMAKLILTVVDQAFTVGIKISAPFLIFSLVFNAGLGLLSKLMPQMQVFFVAMPLSILGGFAMLMLTISVVMGVFQGQMTDLLRDLSLAR